MNTSDKIRKYRHKNLLWLMEGNMMESATPIRYMDFELLHGDTEEGKKGGTLWTNACCNIGVQLSIHLNYFNIKIVWIQWNIINRRKIRWSHSYFCWISCY